MAKPYFDQTGAQPLDNVETPPASPTTSAAQKIKSRPGSVTILGLLLLLQAVGLFDFGLFFFTRGFGLKRNLIVELLIAEPVNALAMSIIFIPLSLLALLAAVGFFRLWRAAWVMAMLTQGLSLLTALVLYFNQQPGYVYISMLFSIFMVIYLNTSEVYAAFALSPSLEEEDDEP
jgi:hypothetical protein